MGAMTLVAHGGGSVRRRVRKTRASGDTNAGDNDAPGEVGTSPEHAESRSMYTERSVSRVRRTVAIRPVFPARATFPQRNRGGIRHPKHRGVYLTGPNRSYAHGSCRGGSRRVRTGRAGTRNVSVAASDDVAFSYCLHRVSGTLKNGQHTDWWLRWTAGYRKIACDGAS
jgi:hypothetical protein